VSLANLFEEGVRGAINFSKELVNLGLETQRQERAFALMTASLGVNAQALEAALESASSGIADVSDVMTTAVQGLQEGLRPEQLVRLMEIATAQSQLMGTTVVQAYNDITRAIVAQQERGLKTAGIYIDTTKALEDQARALGTTVDRLTEAQKVQAFYNATNEKTRETVQNLNTTILTNSQAVEKLGTAWTNTKENIGKFLVESGAALVRWALSVADAVSKAGAAIDAFTLKFVPGAAETRAAAQEKHNESVRELARATTSAAVSVNRFGTNTAAADTKVRESAASLKKAADEAKKTAEEVQKIDDALRAAVTGFDADVLEAGWKAIEDRMASALKQAEEIDATLAAIPGNFEGDILEAQWLRIDERMASALKTALEIDAVLDGMAANFEGDILEAQWTRVDASMARAARQAEDIDAALEAIPANFEGDILEAQIRRQEDALDAAAKASGQWRLDVEKGFLSVTDTFTKMADGLIAGTLDIGDAFANLGRNLLANFAQLVIHRVFDPVLKAAASFVSDLISTILGGFGGGGGGGGVLGALGGLVGGIFGGGGGSVTEENLSGLFGAQTGTSTGSALAGGGGGGGMGSLLNVGGGLTTLYSFVAQLTGLPSIMSLAKTGLIALGEGIGILGATAGAAAPAISVVGAETAALAAEMGLIGVEVGALGAASGASATALVGPIAGLGALSGSLVTAGIALPGLIVSMGIFVDTLDEQATALRRFRQQRFAAAEVTDVGMELETLTLKNALDAEHIKALQIMYDYAQSIHDIGNVFETGMIEGFPVERPAEAPQFLVEARKFMDQLTRIGFTERPEVQAATRPEGLQGAFAPFLFREQANALLVAYVEKFDALMGDFTGTVGTGVDAWETFIRVMEATNVAESFNTIADALGVARQAVPDFVAAVGEDFDKLLLIMREGLTKAIVEEPAKILQLLDLNALARSGEAIEDTALRMANALAGLDGLMEGLAEEAEGLRNGAAAIPAQLADVTRAIAEETAALRQVLTSTGDPEVMLQAATRIRELIIAEHEATVEAVARLVDQITDLEGSIADITARSASLIEAAETEIARIREESVRQQLDAVSALAGASTLFGELGISIAGLTSALSAAIAGMQDAATQVQALPALISSAVAEARQTVSLAPIAATGPALSAAFTGAQAIEDPSARLAALQGVMGALDSLYQQTVASVRQFYDEARNQAQTLHDDKMRQLSDERRAVEADTRTRIEALEAQRSALETQIDTSREWAQIAKDLAADISALKTSEIAPPNAQAQFAEAMRAFQAAPPAEAGEAGRRLLEVALRTGLVTKPDPQYQQLFRDVTDRLESIRADAQSKGTPEQEAVSQLEQLNAQIEAARTEGDARAAAIATREVAAADALRAQIAQLGVDQTRVIAEVQAGFRPLVEATAGAIVQAMADVARQAETDTAKQVGAIDKVTAETAALLRPLEDQLETAKKQLTEITGTKTAAEFLKDDAKRAADALDALDETIHTSLETLVGNRLQALVDGNTSEQIKQKFGGTLGDVVTAVDRSTNVTWALLRLSRHLGLADDSPPASFAQGTFRTSAGPAILHEDEVVVPSSISAAQWVREGGFLQPQNGTRQTAAPTMNVTIAPGAIVIHGASDPNVGAEFERRLISTLNRVGIRAPRQL
jgi:hypothetical protein